MPVAQDLQSNPIRPRELTRKELRLLALALDRAGFTEANLTTAWREMTNQEIAAGIVGHIRRAALGDPLVPFGERVETPSGNRRLEDRRAGC